MYPKELVKKIHQSLPQEILQVITSETTLAALDKLQDDYGLTQQQRGYLEYEFDTRLLGLTHKTNFIQRILDNVGVGTEVTSKLAAIFDQVIVPQIPEKLLQAQEEYGQAKLKEFLNHPTPTLEELLLPEHATPEPEGSNAPPPLEIKNEPAPEVRIAKPSYPAGIDPYREPLE